MYFCLVIAIFCTIYWIDSLVISVTNAKINPYSKTHEDIKRINMATFLRLFSLFLAAIFWGAVIYFWK
jgi:hypothetical protein